MASGDLPNVAKLGERSLRGRVCNPHALEAGAVWPTFHTGLLPGHQPQYDGQRYFDSQTYSDKWFDGQSVEPALWQHLSALGKRCLVIDAPYVRLDPSLDGVMILDWASHVAADGKTAALQTHPAALKDDLIARLGPDPAGGVDCDQRKIESIADHQRFLDDYLERIERKGELTVSMLEEGGWNYAETVFTGLHCVGHRLWHIRDESHPRHDAATHQAIGDPIRDSYQAFDSALGRILEVVDDRTTVLVYVSHGMGPQYTGTGLLDKMLSVIEQGKRVRSTSRPLKARVRDLWFRVPGGVRSAVRPLRKPFSGALDINVADEVPDRRTRRFFEVHANNATGGVRLNLKGREGQGLVEPAEARSILEDLRTAILDVCNAETG
ncbi:MAG: alkaline phosphatase family protein, partial [Acidimicrobiia bacterium]|nr:alkaline phosphatase family protein [Acidimicrobiia bacterium]